MSESPDSTSDAYVLDRRGARNLAAQSLRMVPCSSQGSLSFAFSFQDIALVYHAAAGRLPARINP